MPNSPGDIGIEFPPAGNMNLVSPTLAVVAIWLCSPFVVALGGVALPLLMVSVLAATELLLQEVSTCDVDKAWEVITPGYCHTGDLIPGAQKEKRK